MVFVNQARYAGLALAFAALGLGSLVLPGTSTAEVDPRGAALGALDASTEEPLMWCASSHEDGAPGIVEEASLSADGLANDGSPHPEQCFWAGTAPFCEGSCPLGFAAVAMDRCGDGNCCVTGWKVYCCPA